MTITTYIYTTTYANGLEIAEAIDFDSFEFDFEQESDALEAEFVSTEEV